MTIFGPVTVDRLSYGAREHASLRPMDRALNLPRRVWSFGVQRRVAIEAAKGSFGETVRTLRTTTGAHIAHRQAEQTTVDAAEDFDAFYQKRACIERIERSDDLLIVSVDGKGVVMRHDDLRPRTQAGARSHKLKHRVSKGEKRNYKRMATVATVYDIAPRIRTPEDIVTELRPVHAVAPERPRPANKRVWASIAKPAEHVIEEAIDEALRRDPEKKRRWVFLTDGNRPQIRHLKQVAQRRQIDATIVLDVIHVLGYLWAAAFCFHREGSPDAESWVRDRLVAILRGQASRVAACMRSSATKRDLGKRAPVDACAAYLLANKALLRYDDALKRGLPIATGVIEGACRHLIKDRMDITGARWSLRGAEAILRLRSLRSSGDFDSYWSFHLDQERLRNHDRHYDGGSSPAIATVLPMPHRWHRPR
jgi:hypothetical protein